MGRFIRQYRVWYWLGWAAVWTLIAIALLKGD